LENYFDVIHYIFLIIEDARTNWRKGGRRNYSLFIIIHYLLLITVNPFCRRKSLGLDPDFRRDDERKKG